MCGLTKDDFKSARCDIDEHREVFESLCESGGTDPALWWQGEHNIISYIFLILHLQRKKDAGEFRIPGPRTWTAQELYVAECVAAGDASFFPIGEHPHNQRA